MKRFVIIGGAPRSGTNLARRIIGSHSQIAIPPGEFQLFNQLARGARLKQALSNPRLQKWGIDFAPYYDRDPREVYVEVLQTFANKSGKAIPGEKSPFNEFWYDDIKIAAEDYDLKFIQLVRNPFDVLASYKHMEALKENQNYGLNEISVHMRNWHRSVSMGLARTWNEPDSYRVLRYEDLASRPEETTASLCQFIGVEFERDRMLGLAEYSGDADNTSFADASGEGHGTYTSIKAPVSRKGHLSREEIDRIAATCGELAAAFGYADPDFRISTPERQRPGLAARIKRLLG